MTNDDNDSFDPPTPDEAHELIAQMTAQMDAYNDILTERRDIIIALVTSVRKHLRDLDEELEVLDVVGLSIQLTLGAMSELVRHNMPPGHSEEDFDAAFAHSVTAIANIMIGTAMENTTTQVHPQ